MFTRWLTPVRQCEWVVYAKRPFAGPEAVLAYLSRYTHRVAISNSRPSSWRIVSGVWLAGRCRTNLNGDRLSAQQTLYLLCSCKQWDERPHP